mmetsp:Transcript_23891/g.45487  ORF Transcript_23891/g.45487 Transcript_23891/m.45487 type:complete len:452 (-) Transcript_23891:304-1659(-)
MPGEESPKHDNLPSMQPSRSLSSLQEEIYSRACPNFPPPHKDIVEDATTHRAMSSEGQAEFASAMRSLVGSLRNIAAEMNPDKAVKRIIKECAGLLSADRVTIYSVEENGDLVMKGSTGRAPARIPKGRGIPSFVASTAQCKVVNDVSMEQLFDEERDKSFDYHTKNMLCAPATDASGRSMAVLEVVNKLPEGTPFTELDEILVTSVAAVGGMTLRNCEVFNQALVNEMRANGLTDIISALRLDNNANSLMFTINRRIQSMVNAEKSTFFVCDHNKHRLLSGSTDRAKQLKFPMGTGIVGHCATTRAVVHLKSDVQEHQHYDQVVDKPTGVEPRSVICAPIVVSTQQLEGGIEESCIGVLQLVNRKDSDCFTEDDVNIVTRVCDLISKYGSSRDAQHILHVSNFEALKLDTTAGEGEATRAFSKSNHSRRSFHSPSNHMNSFREAEEENGE